MQDGVIKLGTLDNNLLGFGSIASHSAKKKGQQSQWYNPCWWMSYCYRGSQVEQMGKITVEVRSCKPTKTFEVKNTKNIPFWKKQSIKNSEETTTKWKTVSAGLNTCKPTGQRVEYGPFCQTITLFYMDWETMGHNRRMTQPKLMQRAEFEQIKSDFMKSNGSNFK